MDKVIIFDWGRTLYDNPNERLFPETREVLEYLKGKYRLAIVSLAKDRDFERRRQIIETEKLAGYFVSILFTATDKDRLYEKTLEMLGVNPSAVTVVDDRTIRGIQWGNRRGATTIRFRNGKFANDPINEETGTPTHTITNLGELIGIL
jgi:FMN phosphatase YigB (HAD superfamily)